MNRISTRLAVSFLVVALLPTLPLSLVVRDLLERRFGPAIAEPLETALEAGLDESRAHLAELRRDLEQQAAGLAFAQMPPPVVLLDSEGFVQPADSLRVVLNARPDLGGRLGELEAPGPGSAAPARRFADVLATAVVGPDGAPVAVIRPLPGDMVIRATELTDGLSLLRIVRGEQNRVVLSFVGPFLLVYGLLTLVALLVGFLWSRQMVGPLEMLVGATRRVARGELGFKLPRRGPGEVGELVESFDTMVGRLEDQRRDLARLERAAAWRGMARTLAHEVKNPLTPILLAVNQARDRYPGDDEAYRVLLQEVAEIVGEEVESLRRLVREFGDFARLPRPEPRPGDLQALLRDVEQLYGPERLECVAPDSIPGHFDPDALRRVLVNLVDNGLAASEGTPVRVAAIAVGDGARIVVRDQGAGIAPEHLDRIFEPDFTTKSDGMGLGLAIVENIVVGHGGRIRVASKPGAGATFSIDLPLTAPAPPTDASKEDTP